MTNNMIVSINVAFLIISFVILPGAIKLDKKSEGSPFFTFFYISLIFWQIMETLLFILKDPWWIRYLYDIKLIGVACAAVLFALLIIRFFQLDSLFDKRKMFLLWVIPIITTILCLTTTQHSLIRTKLQIVQLEPLLEIINERGVWFYIHTAYCTILVVLMLILSIIRLVKVPTVYRTGPFWLTIVLSVLIGGALIDMLKIRFDYLDFFLVGASIAGILYYLASTINEKSNYLFFEGREIFNYLDKAILIIDDDGFIADSNHAASKWLQLFGVTDPNMRFEPLLKQLEDEGKITKQTSADQAGEYIIVDCNDYPITYQLQRFSMDHNHYSGFIITMEDVTRARLATERLHSTNEQLPDCSVRHTDYYENLLHCLSLERELPLGVIMVGIRHKDDSIEDASIHQAALDQAMQIMHEHCPDYGCVIQIGTHKFVVLLPDYTPDKLNMLTDKITDLLRMVIQHKLSIGWHITHQPTKLRFIWDNMDTIQRIYPIDQTSGEAYNEE